MYSLVAPLLYCIIWFCVFGGAAIKDQWTFLNAEAANVAANGTAVGSFVYETVVDDATGIGCYRVNARVERFDRRPIEPFELFTSEFGQNSVRIQENSSRIFRKFLKFEKFSTFSKVFSEIPRNFRQNRCKIR